MKGQLAHGSLLFADVSGFTALSEQLANQGREGAEKLTKIMNNYFKVMVSILSRSGGILIKFAGDATLIYFPAQKKDQQALWSVRAGLRMLRAMEQFKSIETAQGSTTLNLKIGIATGDIYLGSIGSAERMEYTIMGKTVLETMHAEGLATANQLIVDLNTRSLLGEEFQIENLEKTFFRIDLKENTELDNFEIRAGTRRARGPLVWQLSPEAAIEQMTTAINQIEALSPYLPNELVERIVLHAKKRKIESEYRATTVIFCNFTGPEALLTLWGEKGISRVTALLAAYFNSIHDIVNHYGGIISRIDPYAKGTKLLILFGAPVMHEDDPTRAVNAALAMNTQLDALNQRWTRKFRRHLPDNFNLPLIQHRIGITQGLTFAGQVGSSTRHEYTVMGDDVNLSARLMAAATWGQILISQRVRDAVNGYFFETRLQPIMVKGKSKPIPIAQVDGKRDDTILLRINQEQPLIGRDEAFNQALSLLEDKASKTPRILTVYGPPGIGKSHFSDRVTREALKRHYEPIIIQAEMFSQNIERHGLNLFLQQIFRTSQNDHPDLLQTKIESRANALNLTEDHLRVIGLLMGVDISNDDQETNKSNADPKESLELWDQLARDSRENFSDQTNIFKRQGQFLDEESILEAFQNLCDAITEKTNLILYLENADWIDKYSKDILLNTFQTLPPAKAFVIINQRQPLSKAERKTKLVINLEPLNQNQSTMLVSHILLESLSETIHEQTHGVPLFIKEISEYIQRQLDFTAKNLSEMLQSSNFMQQLVLSRLEVLPEDQRETARVASVIGTNFRFGEIKSLIESSIDNVTLSNNLRALTTAGIIDQIEAGVDSRYTFSQPHIQEAIYQSLPYDRRRDLHAVLGTYLNKGLDTRRAVQKRIASFLGSTEKTDPLANLERVAYHYEKAEENLDAARIHLKAALQARDQGAYDRAGENINKGLIQSAKTKSTKSARITQNLLEAKVDLCMLDGKYHDAEQVLDELINLSLNTDNLPPRVIIKRFLVQSALDQAQESLQIDTGESSSVEIQNLIAIINLWHQHRQGEPISINSSRLDQDQLNAALEGVLCELTADYDQAISIYRDIKFIANLGINQIRLGDLFLAKGNPTSAEKNFEQAYKNFDELDDSCGKALAIYCLARSAFQQNDKQKTKKHLSEFEDALAPCPSEIFKEGANIINRTRQILRQESDDALPDWRWQNFTDRITIKTFLAHGLLCHQPDE